MKKKKSRYKEEIEEPKAVKRMKKNKQKQLEKESKEQKKQENRKKRKKRIKLFIMILVVGFILFSGISLAISAHTFETLAKDMIKNESSVVVDRNGTTIATIGNEKRKSVISFDKIPDNLKNAYVAIEDERFYSHHGIDVKRTGAAIFSYIIHFGKASFGGSTITQQLVKNLTGDDADSVTRKVNEWWKAWLLENTLTKDEILGSYLNVIYVGPGIYGVDAGATYYFNKSASELTLEECAFLAGINHSPNSYNPFGEKDNTEKIQNRTITVLEKMKELGYIQEEEYTLATDNVRRGLAFKKGKVEATGNGVYSYHTDALISEVVNDLEKKYHISEDFATNYLNMAGVTIHSTQDSEIQKETEKEMNMKKYQLPSQKSDDTSQAAMVIMDHKTGEVLGCVGGLGEKTQARPLNRATQSVRQTGSSIKPLAVLAPAIDKKIVTAASIYDDTEKDFENGYHPTDYNKSLGKITVRRAVESSQNIPFVEIMEELTPKTSIQYLKKMGITTLTEQDESLPLALGGLDKGISPLQMAGGYSTIANDGVYIEPTFYTTLNRKDGSIVLETKQEEKRVFSKETAYILKSLLTQPVVGKDGTATYCKISGVDVAAKTGTTDENYDRWLCGFTPYYTAVTWFGYDQNETVNFNKRNPAGMIWANVMARIHTGLPTAKFQKPNRVLSAVICADTGKKATTGCSNTYTEYFLWPTVPEVCDVHLGNELKENEIEDTNITNSLEKVPEITEPIDAIEAPRETPPTNTITNESKEDENIINTTNNINNNTNNEIDENTNTISNNVETNTINENKTNTDIENKTEKEETNESSQE